MRITFNPNKINMMNSIFALSTQNTAQNRFYMTSPLKADTFEKSTEALAFTGCKTSNFEIKSLKNLRCPVCGLIMLDDGQINQFVNDVANKKGADLVRALEKYEDDFVFTGIEEDEPRTIYRPQKQEVVNVIKSSALEHPDKSLAEIVQLEADNHIEGLIRTQEKVIKELKNYVEYARDLMEPSEELILNKIIDEGEKSIKGEGEEEFKRKRFIYALSNKVEDKRIQSSIIQIASKMPTSDNEVDAFFVKYSKGNRSSREIASKFVQQSIATAEHIHPKSIGGPDSLKNYFCDCADCNSARSNMPFYDWQKTVPNFQENLQEYLNEVQKALEEGQIDQEGYANYIPNVIATIDRLSQGEIKLEVPEITDSYTLKQKNLQKYASSKSEFQKGFREYKSVLNEQKKINDKIQKIESNIDVKTYQEYIDIQDKIKTEEKTVKELIKLNASDVDIDYHEQMLKLYKSKFAEIQEKLGIPENLDEEIAFYEDALGKFQKIIQATTINTSASAQEKSLLEKKKEIVEESRQLKEQINKYKRAGIRPEESKDWDDYLHLEVLEDTANELLGLKKGKSKNLNTIQREVVAIALGEIMDRQTMLSSKDVIVCAKAQKRLERIKKEDEIIEEKLASIKRSVVDINSLNVELYNMCGTKTYDEVKKEYEQLLLIKNEIASLKTLSSMRMRLRELEIKLKEIKERMFEANSRNDFMPQDKLKEALKRVEA